MTHREQLQFPSKEAGLREDVHALGGLVGEVVRDQGGAELFDLVEGDRVTAIRQREGDPKAAVELVVRTANRPVELARDLIRAFGKWFEVVNLAEQVHRLRRRQEYLTRSDRPQPGGIGDCLYRLKAAGFDGEQVLSLLRGVTIYPVFTAHPTESTRRTMLRKQQQIADLMAERLDPTLTPDDRRAAWERIRTEVTAGWQTEVHPRERLTVADEREHVLFYLAEVIYRVVPALYEELGIWLQAVFGVTVELGGIPRLLRFGTWVGGDMDNNSEVHAKTVRETLHRQQQLIISTYYEECRALSDKLSQSASRVGVSRELEERIAEYAILLPNAHSATPMRHDRMPYRIFLTQVAERLRTTYDGRPNHYEKATQFIHDLEIVADSLRANRGRHAGLFPVERLLCRARTFGFHLATLDLRQHAAVHREVIRQGLGRADWPACTPTERASVLRESLARDRGPIAAFDAVGRRTLAVFEAMMQGRYKYGEHAIGDYVVSGTEATEDVLGVLLLARWADITDRGNDEVPLDVVPLIESARALEGAGGILDELLGDPLYRRHLAARGDRQTVLIGYSDSNKEIGIAASRQAIYEAQTAVLQVAAAQAVELSLFHGRGGTASRGGGPLDRLVASAPAGAIRGRLRVTEQGEGISDSYGLRRIALRSFEKAVYAVMQEHTRAAPLQAGHHLELMQRIASASRARYRGLVYDEADFYGYFRAVTPIDVIERMQIGGRVAHRAGGTGIEALRTIPWVFAWNQSRHALPGWYGAGTGLDTAARELGAERLTRAWSEWPFFANLLDDIEIELARADLGIAAHYDELAEPAMERFAATLRGEYALAQRWVTWIKGEVDLLDSRPRVQRSVLLRSPYLDPMHLMQVDLLRRWRESGREDRVLFEALLASVTGIAQGLQTTG